VWTALITRLHELRSEGRLRLPLKAEKEIIPTLHLNQIAQAVAFSFGTDAERHETTAFGGSFSMKNK
jgi:hypothetical protein